MNQQLLQQLCDEYSVGLLEGDELERLTKSVDAGDPAVLDQLRESADLLAELAWLAPPSQRGESPASCSMWPLWPWPAWVGS